MRSEHLTEEEIQHYALNEDAFLDVISGHVTVCEECTLRVKEYQAVLRALSEQPTPVFDFDLTAAVLDRMEPVKNSAGNSWLLWVVVPLCVLMAGGSIFIFRDYLLSLYAGVGSFTLYLIITGATTLFVILCIDMYKNFQKKIRALEVY